MGASFLVFIDSCDMWFTGLGTTT